MLYECLLRCFLTCTFCVDFSTFISSCGLLCCLSQCSLRYSANMWSVWRMEHNSPVICYLIKMLFTDFLELSCFSGWSYTWQITGINWSIVSPFLPLSRGKKLKLGKIHDIMTPCVPHDKASWHSISSCLAGMYELSSLWLIHLPWCISGWLTLKIWRLILEITQTFMKEFI